MGVIAKFAAALLVRPRGGDDAELDRCGTIGFGARHDVGERAVGIDQFAIHPRADRGLGEFGPDLGGGRARRGRLLVAVGNGERVAVGELNLHGGSINGTGGSSPEVGRPAMITATAGGTAFVGVPKLSFGWAKRKNRRWPIQPWWKLMG